MATLDQIVRFGQQPSPLIQGLQSLVPAAQAIGDARRRNKRQEAANLLGQAFSDDVSDPAEIDALRAQARELDPEYTFQVEQAVAKRARDMQATPYQQERLALDKEKLLTRQHELDERATDRELKREELKLKTEQRKQKLEQEKKATESKIEKSQTLAKEASILARSIANSDRLENITGSKAYLSYTPTGAERQDLINDALRLQSLLTFDNLSLMSGVLTDRDIQFLSRIGTDVNITEDGILGSHNVVKGRLTEIANKIDSALNGNTDAQTPKGASPETVIHWNDMQWQR
jgi:hypothetical protein